MSLTYKDVLQALARADPSTNWMKELSPIVHPLSLQEVPRDVLVPIRSKELSDGLKGVKKHLSQAENAEISPIIDKIARNQKKMNDLFDSISKYIVGDQGLLTLIPCETYSVSISPDIISTIRKNLNGLKRSDIYFRTMFEYQTREMATWKRPVVNSMHNLSRELKKKQKFRNALDIYKADQTAIIKFLLHAKQIMEQYYDFRETFLNYLMGKTDAEKFQNVLQ